MGTLAGAYYADAVGDKVAIANLTEWRGAVSIHPTLNIAGLHQHRRRQARRHERQPLRVRRLQYDTGRCDRALEDQGRQYDDPNLGAQVYQYDIWRSPFSNIQQTSGKNLGVMRGLMRES